MAHLDVVQAVETRLRSFFSACPVFVENELLDPPADGSSYLQIDFPWSRSDWETTDGEFLEEGAFRFVLAVDRGTGTHQGRAWLDEIAAHFRGAAFAGIQCYAPDGAVTDDRSDDASYFKLAIAVPYQFIILGD